MKRRYPDAPVAAVGVIVLREDEGDEPRILLVRREAPPAAGKWSIPGGAVEIGEPVREAAVREVMEECGLEVNLHGVYDVFDIIVRDGEGKVEYQYVLVDFVASPVTVEPRPASDAGDARWVGLSEALGMDLTKGTREVVMRLMNARNMGAAASRWGLPQLR